MKKTNKATSLALATLLSLGSAVTSFAAIPEMTVVIGDKAYHLDYANDPANEGEIIAQIGKFTPADIFIKGPDGKWIVNETQEELADVTKIPAVVYKDKDGEKEFAQHDGEEVTDLKVVSVSAINAITLEVKFSAPVDKRDAELPANTSLEGIVFTSRTLSEDGKTLTLKTTPPVKIEVKDATLTVQPIKSQADSTVKSAKYVKLFTYKDTEAPHLESIEASTKGDVATEIKIKATEWIAAGNIVVKVNGKSYTVNFVNKDEVTLPGLSLEKGKTHTLEIFALKDLTGNITASESKTFEVTVDVTAPTVELSTEGDKVILVTFDKPMNSGSVIAALPVNSTVKDETLANVNATVATLVPDTDDKQYKITITDTAIYNNKEQRTFTIPFKDTIEDKLGNKMEATTKTVILKKDTVKPAVTGYNIVKDADGKVTKIEFSLNKSVIANLNPDEPSSIVLANGVGTTAANFLGVMSADALAAGDKKLVYTGTVPAKLSGKITFNFDKDLLTDQSLAGNKSDAFVQVIDFGAEEVVTEFEVNDGATTIDNKNEITVTFEEAVTGGAVANSATDVKNYSINGTPLTDGDGTITLDAALKVATLKLTKEFEETLENAVFGVSNIKDITGKKMLKAYTKLLDIQDNVAPEAKAAVLEGNYIIVEFTESMNTVAAADIKITVDGKELADAGLTVAPVISTDQKKYSFKLKVANDSTRTYIDVNNNNAYDAGNDVVVKIEGAENTDVEHSTDITSIKVNVVAAPATSVDKSGFAGTGNKLEGKTELVIK